MRVHLVHCGLKEDLGVKTYFTAPDQQYLNSDNQDGTV